MTTNMKRIVVYALVLVTAGGAALPTTVVAQKQAPATVTPPTPTSGQKPKPAAPVARKDVIRTLEAIHIEGEIPVPQVLFITARDSRRFRDGLGHRYQVGALELARSVSLPDRLRVTAQPEKP